MKKMVPVFSFLLLIIIGLGISVYSLYHSNQEYKEREQNYKNKLEYLEKENNKLKEERSSGQDVILEYDNDHINVSTNDKYENLEEISVAEFLEKVNHKESFIVLFSQPKCGHCIAFKPVFNQVLKDNNIKAYDVNVYNLPTLERESLYSVVKISGTPTTLFFEDGEENINYRMVGNLSSEKIIQKLTSAGYIK